MEERQIIATAIANARGMRHGVPPVKNILSILPDKLIKEVYGDADLVMKELNANGYKIVKSNSEHNDTRTNT